jgi:chromate reductase
MAKHIGIIIGSLRKDSFNRKLAQNIQKLITGDAEASIIEIGGLELYNQDYDDFDQAPQSYKAFRKTMQSVDAVIFITPEYNRSIPAVIKNALDVGSRPYGKSVWDGKPALVISSSPGAFGGFGANHQLRQSLVFLNMPTVQQPEMYLHHVNECFDAEGNIVNQDILKMLKTAADALQKMLG